jgi:aryl carrier-like protein
MNINQRHLVIQTNEVDDSFDQPKCAVIQATDEFVAELDRLRNLCAQHGLDSVRVIYAPDKWLPEESAAELRMSSPSMVVTPSSFWFEDQPKHAQGHLESVIVDIDQVFDWLKAGDADLMVADNEDELDEFLQEIEATFSFASPATST